MWAFIRTSSSSKFLQMKEADTIKFTVSSLLHNPAFTSSRRPLCVPQMGRFFAEMVHNGNLVTRIVTVGDGIKVVRRLS
ncbi:hypothetical protein DPMN_065056 [Dreissena polymorpha]|uniref:Uncharacterized protein n=1 Tax=Dreissena polymorpha TaxID=45954 RepID=A0A9D4HLK9_DREPO|nr:hypothetical protein DPMN_065056 [Dreissena polymorpha]